VRTAARAGHVKKNGLYSSFTHLLERNSSANASLRLGNHGPQSQ
jgi:hypothetical protein